MMVTHLDDKVRHVGDNLETSLTSGICHQWKSANFYTLTLYPVAFSNFLSRPSLEFEVVNFWFDSDEPKPIVLAYKTPSGFWLANDW